MTFWTEESRKTLRRVLDAPSDLLWAIRGHWPAIGSGHQKIQARIAKQQINIYGRPVVFAEGEADRFNLTGEDEARIEYYLGNIGKQAVSLHGSSQNTQLSSPPDKPVMLDRRRLLQIAVNGDIQDGYTLSLLNLFDLLPDAYKEKKFLYRYGDHPVKNKFEGLTAKTRQVDDLSVTLLNLNPARHWKLVRHVKSNDVLYRQKKDIAVWRGATTGSRKTKGTRTDLVSKYFDRSSLFDVGFNQLVQGQSHQAHLLKNKMSLSDQMRYKFLICAEGNDVASGLKWMLQSNSVVMMPKPTICSWLMEDRLEPFVHYIPLADDFSDAEEQVNWALKHEAECMDISDSATVYMSQFSDPMREVVIEREVLRRYLDKLTIY